MMTDITIPIWLLALSAGVPCISLLGLLIFVLRRIRTPQKELFVQMSHAPHDTSQLQTPQFQNNLFASQIDAVFNGLCAIIETERIKMNSLLKNTAPMAFDDGSRHHTQEQHNDVQPVQAPVTERFRLQEQIDKIAAAGEQTEAIAEEMGLSQAEVELALKMRSARASGQHRRLEAVA